MTETGRGVSQVKVVSDTLIQLTDSSSPVNLTGAGTSVAIPGTWGTGMILARFSSQVEVDGTDAACVVRILIGGSPAAPGERLFDDARENATAPARAVESNTMEAYRADLGPGTYAVQVQFRRYGGLVSDACFLGPYTLVVERIRQT